MSDRVARLAAACERHFGVQPEGFAEAPGRVNLIGEHLDYNLGWVLPVAIDRTALVAYARRNDRRVEAFAIEFDEQAGFSLDEPAAADRPWLRYVAGMAWALAGAGQALPGLDLAIQSDVPIGAGLSSSAALEVAAAGAWRQAGGLEIDARELALLAKRAENDFVGVACGAMDQLTAALARAGHALRIDCATLDYEHIPLALHGVRLIIVDSAVRRELRDSPYNRRREECAEALAIAGRTLGRELAGLALLTEADLPRLAPMLEATLLGRVRHVVSEQARVRSAVEALRRSDAPALGELLWQSHASLRDDFDVTCRELDLLVELAAATDGVLGARLTGAGFGGCTVQLVREECVDSFGAAVVERYRRETGLPAEAYVTTAAGGLRTWPAGR